ncbi:MAG TPA: hypothetical protein DEQ14_03735 [Treponema sp.]|nr:hypothetical protein [Treponema sp.]
MGHEAYRDGYSPGKLNNNTDLSAIDSNSDEIMKVSVARIMMADRVNQDYQWFYEENTDFAIESALHKIAVETGNMRLLEVYLHKTYENDEDYFFQKVSTGGEFQNSDQTLRYEPLLNGPSIAEVEEINGQKLKEAFLRYKAQLAIDEEYKGDLNDFVSKEGTDEELWKKFVDDTTKLKEFGYNPVKFESFYHNACMFMSTKYALEAVIGRKVDTMWMHETVKESGLVTDGNELSRYSMAEIMDRLAGEHFDVKLAETEVSAKRLRELWESENKYIVHLRIKNGDYFHSVMLSDIEFGIYSPGITIEVAHVANPWDGNSHSGKKEYRGPDIGRIDVLQVTETDVVIPVFGYPPISPEKKYSYLFSNSIYQWIK